MDTSLLLLRILHFVCGTFWVGSDAFVTFLLIPRLKTLGPDIERKVMGVLLRILPPAMTVSSVITAVTGTMLVGALRGWNFSSLFATGWGWAILVGIALTVAAMVVGFGLLPPLTMKSDKLSQAIEGRSPTPEEGRQLDRINARITSLALGNSMALILVVGAMAIARFV